MSYGIFKKACLASVMMAACNVAVAQTSAPASMQTPKSATQELTVSPDSMKTLFQRAIKRGDDFWKGEFWVDHRDMYCGGAHTTTMLYYVLAYANLSGDTSYVPRVEKHYQWMRNQYWLERENCWKDPHDVMMNACLALNVSAALQIGSRFLPSETRQQMEADLRYTCVYLSKNNTAVLNNDDLRACNQDAISAAALAISADYFKDPSIKRMAVEKVSLILRRSQGPFWVEGGIDKNYQSVGEAALAVAADILWDDLTVAQKRQIADLYMRPYATNTLGAECMRSETTLGVTGEGSLASAILARVPNPLIAADVFHTFKSRQSMRNPWWIFETPAVTYYWGLLRSAESFKNIPAFSGVVGWGGTARLGMKIDEFQNRKGSTDEKTYLTTTDGLVVQFGDTSAWNPQYAFKKRHAEKLPLQVNSGGLRYINRGRKVFAWAEGTYDYPRVVYGANPSEQSSPQRYASYSRPGFTGSQYHLDQVLRNAGNIWSGSVSQEYIVLGKTLLFRMKADDESVKLPNLRYELTIPTESATISGQTLRWQQGSLYEKDPQSQQMLAVVQGGAPAFQKDSLSAFIANERIRLWLADRKEVMAWAKAQMPLSRAQVPIGEQATWALLSVDGTAASHDKLIKSLQFTDDAGLETITYEDDGKWYGIVYLADKTKRDEVTLKSPAGTITLKKPAMGVVQSFVVENNQLTGYFAEAEVFDLQDKNIFSSAVKDKPVQVSSLITDNVMYVDVVGGAAKFAVSDKARSLITGVAIDLNSTVENDRFWLVAAKK